MIETHDLSAEVGHFGRQKSGGGFFPAQGDRPLYRSVMIIRKFVHLAHDLGDGLIHHDLHLHEKGSAESAVFALDIAAAGKPAARFAADQCVRFAHFCGDVFESDVHLVTGKTEFFRHFVHEDGSRAVFDDVPFFSPVFYQIVIECREDIVVVHVFAGVADDAQTVAVAVRSDRVIVAARRDLRFERFEHRFRRIGKFKPEKRVVFGVKHVKFFDAELFRQAGQPDDPRAVQIVEEYFRVIVADLRTDKRADVFHIGVDIGIICDEPRPFRVGQRRARDLFYARALALDPVRQSDVGVASALGENLNPVEFERIVASRDHHAVIEPQIARGAHHAGRRHRVRVQENFHAVARKNFRHPRRVEVGHKPPVVPDDDGLIGTVLPDHVTERLRDRLHVPAGEIVADHPAETSRSELYHR